jgi:hypothetical protein
MTPRGVRVHAGTLAVLAVLLVVAATACTIQVPMVTGMPRLGVQERIPLRATIVIPESRRNYTFTGRPASWYGKARPHVFPLGRELEYATGWRLSRSFARFAWLRIDPRRGTPSY